jgi:hypothetical protein
MAGKKSLLLPFTDFILRAIELASPLLASRE